MFCDVYMCWFVLDFKKLEILKGKYRLNVKLVELDLKF